MRILGRRPRQYGQWLINRIEALRKEPWRACEHLGDGDHDGNQKIALVTVSYNTVDVTRQMLYSLFESGVIADLDRVIVVDNGSTDGSLDYLAALADRNLVTLLRNRWPPYHGPGLNRGMSYLAKQPVACAIEHVWILDSDAIVLRGDTARTAVAVAREKRATFAGTQRRDGIYHLFALLIDPRAVWHRSIPPFQESGLPLARLQRAVLEAGGSEATFEFARDHYVVHLGKVTSQTLLRIGKERNRYAKWISGIKGSEGAIEYEYAFVPGARERYHTFLREYEARAAHLSASEFAALLERMKERLT